VPGVLDHHLAHGGEGEADLTGPAGGGAVGISPVVAVGATVVATWLVEAKQSVIENMAPVLTRIFAPLFALLLIAFVVTMAMTGRAIDVKREVLILFDLLLAVVFGLLLYSASARDAIARPGLMDWIQLTLVGTALVVDVLALWAIGSRIFEFGFTPNRVAALGENIVLLVNLGGSAVLYAGFIRGRVAEVSDWAVTPMEQGKLVIRVEDTLAGMVRRWITQAPDRRLA